MTEKTNKVSWADLLSDDSNSFRTPPVPAEKALPKSAPSSLLPRREKTARRKYRALRTLPLNAEDSYKVPEENSKNSLNADLADFGLWLPKGGVQVEDSNTAGVLSNKRPLCEVASGEETQPPSKRPRGQFPVDPVFGGVMTSRK